MNIRFPVILLAAAAAFSACASGDAVLMEAFDTPGCLDSWSGGRAAYDPDAAERPGSLPRIVPGSGRNNSGALVIDLPSSATATLTRRLDASSLAGRRIAVEAFFKVDRDIVPKQKWNGAKLMFAIIRRNGQKEWPNLAKLTKQGDWVRAAGIADIPGDAESVSLVIGLEECTGKVRIDDLDVTAIPPLPEPSIPSHLHPNDKAQFRGVMSGRDWNMKDSDLDDLRSWGANLLRYQIRPPLLPGSDPVEDYLASLENELPKLDRMLDECAKRRIRVLVDLHWAPYGRSRSNVNYLDDSAESEAVLTEAVRCIARRIKDHPAVYGFEPLNEPSEKFSVGAVKNGAGWHALAGRLVAAIRREAPELPVVIEPPGAGSPPNFRNWKPLNDPRIIYSVHMYIPQDYTHQGVEGRSWPISYPGTVGGTEYNRQRLREVLNPVLDFQKKYRVPIMVGEFSAAAWAPGAAQYLSDCIGIFEEAGWDWTYHAFREWDGWSVEHTGTPGKLEKSKTDTDRRKVLLDSFKRNPQP